MELDPQNNRATTYSEESLALGWGAERRTFRLDDRGVWDRILQRARYFEQDPSSIPMHGRQDFLSQRARYMPWLMAMQHEMVEYIGDTGVAEGAEAFLKGEA